MLGILELSSLHDCNNTRFHKYANGLFGFVSDISFVARLTHI